MQIRSFSMKALVRDPLTWVTIALFALYLLVVALRPPEIFWSLDEGGKFIYLENVIRTRNPAAALDYPGRNIDPHARFIPLYLMIRVSDTEIYSWWPVGFPLVSIPFYQLFGWLGLYVLPAVGGALGALFSGMTVRRLLPGRKRWDVCAVVLVGITTPVFYYSTMFWEHTLSMMFFMSAIYCLITAYQQPTTWTGWILAGGLVSISAFFRTDTLPISAGIGIVILITRFRWALAYGGSFVFTSIPWLLFNRSVMGNFLSRQLPEIDAQGWLLGFRMVGIKFIPYTLFNAPMIQALPLGRDLLILGTVCVFLAALIPFFKHFRWVVLTVYLGLLYITAWALFHPWGYRSVHGFVLIAPHVVFAVWFWVTGSLKKFSFPHLAFLSGSMAYVVVYLLRMWAAGGGQQWGPRYQLALYPLLIILGLVGIAENAPRFPRYLKIGIAVLFLAQATAGLGFEIRGVYWAQKAAEYYDSTRQAIYALPDKPITTNCTFLPMLMPEFYERGNIFNRTVYDLTAWANEVQRQGVSEFYDIEVDICSYDHLDAVVENRKIHPDGMSVQKYNVQDLIK